MSSSNSEIDANILDVERNVIKGPTTLKKSIFQTIGEALFDTLSKEPDHVGQIISDTDEQTTFREMKEKSIRCAMWMKNRGIREDDIVVLCTHNHADTYAPIFATFMVEAIYTAWDHEITESLARSLLKHYKPKIIFADEGAADVLKKALELVNHEVDLVVFGKHKNVRSFDEIIGQQSDDEVDKFIPRKGKDPEKVAAILLTSGTTGVPKGVMYSNKLMIENIFINMKIETVFLSYSMPIWISGFAFLLSSTFARMKRIVSQQFDPKNLCRMIEKYEINTVFMSPAMLAHLQKFDDIEKYDLKSLKEIATGGAKSSKNIVDGLKKRIPKVSIVQYYGMTEVGGGSIRPIKNPSNYDSLGTVAMNAQVKIIDSTSGEALGPNKTGELCIKRQNMMIGYYKDPEATKEVIDAEGWLHTGDFCYYNESGEFFFVDRLKDLMKFQNYQITPTELEEVLMTHPAVTDVAVVSIPHEIDGEWPMAFVTTASGEKVSKEELIALSSVLGEKKKLRGGVKFLDNLPRTATGKIAKAELKRLAKSYGNNADFE